MFDTFINYYDILGLNPKQPLTRNMILDAYLDAKNAISQDRCLSATDADEKLSLLSEALTVVMSPELRKGLNLAIIENKKQRNRISGQHEEGRPCYDFHLFSDKTLFEALIAYSDGNNTHVLSSIPKEEIERELLLKRLWAMHVIKEVVTTKKLPKSIKR